MRRSGPPWEGKRVVLGVCGGIAAYKSVQVARDLTLLGATVDTVLTGSARQFIAPLSFEGVTGRGPHIDLFRASEAAVHISLGREADCICIAPATADFLARVATGRADDLLTTILAATDAPVLLAPAMNDRMFADARTRANLERLDAMAGFYRVGPVRGALAAGEGSGAGRMSEPGEIVDAVGRVLGGGGALRGMRVLITAAATREPVDAVRYLGNRSSGRMGYALARCAWLRGCDVTLVSGPSALDVPGGVTRVPVETALQMRDAVLAGVGDADLVIHAAAVADYRPRTPFAGKMKRARPGSDSPAGPAVTLELAVNPDIACESRAQMKPGTLTVGFALEVSELLERAEEKRVRKGFDLVVANSATEPGAGFESATNRVVILAADSPPRALPRMEKFRVAWAILDEVERRVTS